MAWSPWTRVTTHDTFLGCRWSVALLPHGHPLVEEYFPFPASLTSISPRVPFIVLDPRRNLPPPNITGATIRVGFCSIRKATSPGEANLDATPLAQDFLASERARQPPPDRSLGKPRSPGPASGANPTKRLDLLSLVRRIHLRLTSSRFYQARSTNCQSAAVPASLRPRCNQGQNRGRYFPPVKNDAALLSRCDASMAWTWRRPARMSHGKLAPGPRFWRDSWPDSTDAIM